MNAKGIHSPSSKPTGMPATGGSLRAPPYSYPRRIIYRAAVTRHQQSVPQHTFYDGGDLNPYCLDSLIDLLRAEARLPYTSLIVDLQLTGAVNGAIVREVTQRFTALVIRGLRVRICADGQRPVLISTKGPESSPPHNE